jgi:hypothetical protein
MMQNFDEAIENLNEALTIYNKFEQSQNKNTISKTEIFFTIKIDYIFFDFG